MANYYGNARSNYFKVENEIAFMAAMANISDIEIHTNENGLICLLACGDSGGWPSMAWDEDYDEEYEIDIAEIVSAHLKDGEVAIFMESGAEKMRYIIGFAEAINNKGERVQIGLNQIYELAMDLTDRPMDITAAEY